MVIRWAARLTFWVGQRGADTPQAVRSDDTLLRGAIWLTRLAIYLGLFVGAGGAFFVAWMRTPSAPAMRVIGNVVDLVALAALALSVGLQGLDALALSPSSLSDADVWTVGAHGSFGLSVAIAAAALLLALLSHRAGETRARVMSLGALVGVGLALAVTGHAATASPRWLTAPAVFVHGVALAFWIGSLVPLALAMRGPRQTVIDVLTRFSRVIPFAVAALLASGLLLAIVQLERLDALWTTSYGRVLAFKLVLVLLLLVIALWNRLYLTPRIGQGGVTSAPSHATNDHRRIGPGGRHPRHRRALAFHPAAPRADGRHRAVLHASSYRTDDGGHYGIAGPGGADQY